MDPPNINKETETIQPWREGEKMSSYLDKSTLVDEIANSLQVGAPVGDVGL